MKELVSILEREREQLETLLYRLELEQLVLAHGRTRWLGAAARDVDHAVEDVRATELLRATAADAAVTRHGLDPQAGLSEIAANAPEPWSTILHDLRESFLSITAEIQMLAEANRDLITTGYQAARDALSTIDGATAAYGSDGTAVQSPGARSILIDRNL